MKKTTRNSLLLVLASLIWGSAFVAQSAGGDALGPYTFNGTRFLIGGFVLLPVIAAADRMGLSPLRPTNEAERKITFTGGFLCGITLFIASNLQQVGITLGTPTGKAGFLTSCYIILVPLFGLFLKKKCHWNVWLGVVLTLAGLWLLCMETSLTLALPDTLLLLCAVFFAFQILFVDHYGAIADPIRLSCIQFFTTGILTTILACFTEIPACGGLSSWLNLFTVPEAWGSLAYAGICSSGIAYTLQMIGQQDLNPAIASMLMSLESVFSVLAGWLLLHQILSLRELAGCAVIFAAVLLAQLPVGASSNS